MANKMVANIKSLSEGVTGLTKHVNELYAALAKVNIVASKTLKEAKGAVNTVGGTANLTKGSTRMNLGTESASFAQPAGGSGLNRMSTSLAKFSQTPGGMAATAVASGALSIAAGAYAAVPDVSLTMQRSVGYYQAGLRAPGINRNQLERATFGAMGGGLSSTGSDAIVAATLAGRGYTPGSKNYLQAAGEVGGAYKYLGIENAPATQAIAAMHSGAMGANLFQYGITTSGPDGKDKTMGQIAKELMGYMGASGASTEQVRSSYQKGALGANLATMGFDAATQEMLYQSMIDISSGRNPDLSKAKPMAGNENTALTAAGRMASSQTSLMTKAEDSMIKGFENAADTVEAFNRALSNVVQPLGQLKGYIGGVGGTNAGAGIGTAGAGIMGTLKKLAGVALIAGSPAIGAVTGGVGGAAAAVAGVGLLAGGGSTSGYGSSFGVGSRGRSGGASPVAGAAVSAGYGATDNSGVWAATNNTHTGNDYATPIGTPVTVAYGDGVVTQVDINADYGTSVLIDHADGTQTLYAHLSERSVKVGDTVKIGQRIGKSGDSGNAGGPHLHFEMRKGKNNPVDPNKYLSGGTGSGSTNDLLAMGYSTTVPLPSDVLGRIKTPSKSSTSSSSTASNSASSASSTNNGTVAMGSKDQQSWATDFLTKTGKPVTESNLKALTTWMNAEGKGWSTSLNRATYNPLNTTLDRPGAISFNAPGVKAYTSPEQGMEATIATLTGKSADARGYTAIMNALTTGTSSQDVLNAIDNSAWRSGSVNKGGYNFPTKGGGTTGYGAAMPAPAPALQGNKTVNITLNIERASEQEAMRLVRLVKTHLENDKDLARIGNS